MRLLLLHIFLLMVSCANAQTQKGSVINAETATALPSVTIVNVATGQSTTTDANGNFLLTAHPGDVISYSLYGYRLQQRPATPETFIKITLAPLNVRLPEYIFKDLTPFQKDSVELTTLYSKELNMHSVKPGFSNANGGGFTGLIGGPIQKLSKSYKQNKRFKENFKSDLEQRYIDSRYTPALVTKITGLEGDDRAVFMNYFPMEYGFARAATDLEVKMWIRNNYKEYIKDKH